MYKTLTIAALLCGCIGYLWLNVSDFRLGTTKILPSAPVTKQGRRILDRSTSVSTVSVKVTVDLAELSSLLEDVVPKNEVGSQNEDFGRAFSNEIVSWNIARGGISVSSNGSLNASTSVRGSVRVRGVFKPIRGSVGRLLGGATDIPFSQRANVSARIVLTAKPVVNTNWRLIPNGSASLVLTDASLMIANTFPFSVRTYVDPTLQSKKQDMIAKINSAVASDSFIEDEIRKIHNQLCGIHEFDVEGVSVWLKMIPIGWSAKQPVMDERGLTLSLGVEVKAVSGTGEKPPLSSCPFPTTLKLDSTTGAGEINIRLESSLDWRSIRDTLNTQLQEQRGEGGWSFSNEIGTVDLEKFEVGEFRINGSTVYMKVLFEGVLDAWLDKSFAGHVWVGGTPILDSSSNSLSFQGVELDASSYDVFSDLPVFGGIARQLFKRQIRKLPPISLNKVEQNASTLVNGSFEEFAAELEVGDIEVLSDVVEEVKLESIYTDGSGMHVLVVAKGTLALRVNDLKVGED